MLVDKGVFALAHARLVKYSGNPVMKPEYPWERMGTDLEGCSVIYDEEERLFKMWYNAIVRYRFTGDRKRPWEDVEQYICYATSKDGIRWNKPLDLGVVEYNGSKRNNIVLRTDFSDDCPSELTHPRVFVSKEDQQHRYKMIYMDKGGVFLAFSADGTLWQKYEENPVYTRLSLPKSGVWDPHLKKYVIFTQEDQPRRIGRRESEDLIHWSDDAAVLVPDADDPPGTEFYGMTAFMKDEAYVGILWVFHPNPEEPIPRLHGYIDTQLVCSEDGWRWRRLSNRKPFIERGPIGSFDESMIIPAAPLLIEDELYIYYSGWKEEHASNTNKGCIGLAKLKQK